MRVQASRRSFLDLTAMCTCYLLLMVDMGKLQTMAAARLCGCLDSTAPYTLGWFGLDVKQDRLRRGSGGYRWCEAQGA